MMVFITFTFNASSSFPSFLWFGKMYLQEKREVENVDSKIEAL